MRTQNDIIIADLRSNCSYKGISTGHYIPVARMYQELFKEECKVFVSGGPVYESSFSKDCFVKLPFNVSGDSFFHKLKLFCNSICLFAKAKGRTIILQQSSDVTTHLALALFYWGGFRVFMIRYSCHGIDSKLKQFIYTLCRYKIDGIICPNQRVADAYKRPHIIVPDLIYVPKEEVVMPTSYSDKKYDFCMIGRISEEKGIVEIAEILAKRDYKTIIAGKPQTQELADKLSQICQNSSNIELVLDYISDEQYHQYLNDSRYTILNYKGEYSERSSGVVFDTLFAGVPVIGCRCKALQFIETSNVGYIYESADRLFASSNEGSCICDLLFEETQYNLYLDNIRKYRDTHIDYAKKLIEFITE